MRAKNQASAGQAFSLPLFLSFFLSLYNCCFELVVHLRIYTTLVDRWEGEASKQSGIDDSVLSWATVSPRPKERLPCPLWFPVRKKRIRSTLRPHMLIAIEDMARSHDVPYLSHCPNFWTWWPRAPNAWRHLSAPTYNKYSPGSGLCVFVTMCLVDSNIYHGLVKIRPRAYSES